MFKLDMHSVSLKVRDIQVGNFLWHRLCYFGLGKIHPSYNDKQQEIKRVMHLKYFYISKPDNNFRKSVMICQIIDSVDNHFGEYL